MHTPERGSSEILVFVAVAVAVNFRKSLNRDNHRDTIYLVFPYFLSRFRGRGRGRGRRSDRGRGRDRGRAKFQ